MMTNDNCAAQRLVFTIRANFCDPGVRRFLSDLPLFEPPRDLSESMAEQLRRLDAAERGKARRKSDA